MGRPTKAKIGSGKSSRSKRRKSRGKGVEASAAKYMTRNTVLTHLQLKLPEFRRLCILKGIHPREPPKKFAGQGRTYYHVKDVKFLAHERLLEEGREAKAFEKKIKKARSKRNEKLAERLAAMRPTPRLDHLVKERYPTFIDALRDMDDPLTMLHLFAALPADNIHKIPAERVHAARRLSLEWQAYITKTHSLRKTFVSVKGIYYQVNVKGQDILWLTPHGLSQVLPDDVDYRVMLTFEEFYETLVGFVNFKLYQSLGLSYPPVIKPGEGGAFETLEELMKDAQLKDEEEEEEDEEALKCKTLFEGLRIYLAREVPQESLRFIIRACGGSVCWAGGGGLEDESDESITHQIVDRPVMGHKFLTRDYVQPQWLYDCMNAKKLLSVDVYLHGRVPPSHLSPFVEDDKEVLDPPQKSHALPVGGEDDEDDALEVE